MLRFAVLSVLAVAVFAQGQGQGRGQGGGQGQGPPGGPDGRGPGIGMGPPMGRQDGPGGRRMSAVLSQCLSSITGDVLEIMFDNFEPQSSSRRRRQAQQPPHQSGQGMADAAAGIVDSLFHDVPEAQTQVSIMMNGVKTWFTSSSTVSGVNMTANGRMSTLAKITRGVIAQLYSGTVATGGVTTAPSTATLTTVVTNGANVDPVSTTLPIKNYPAVDDSIIFDVGGNFTLNTAVGQTYEGEVYVLDSLTDFMCYALSVRLAACKATGGITANEATATAAPMSRSWSTPQQGGYGQN